MTALAGTGPLIRLILRRDRVRLSLWIAVVAATTVATASALARVLATAESRAQFGASVTGNPTAVALIGRLFDPSTIGGLTAWRMGGVGAVLVALMSLLTVVRHTRAEEAAGRRELVGSAAVGRHAALAAVLVVTACANLVLAALVAGGLIACDLPAPGAIALGLSFAAAGWVFAALAAVAAQLVENAGAAHGIAVAVVGIAYLARAAGDAGQGGLRWLSWASPIGWAQQIRPFAGERWWILGLAAAVTAALAATAHALCAHRDLGAGVLPPRIGPATASRWLGGTLGLAWRLQRGGLLGWTIGFAVIGSALGGIARSVADLANTSPRIRMLVGALGGQAGIVDAFFAAIFGILGIIASGYAMQAALRLRSEEEDARAEPVLAASVSRLRWATSHLVFATLGPAIALATAAAAAAVVHGGQGDLPRLLAAAMVQLPAVWVLVGVALALFGLAPRFAPASWGVLVGCLLLGQLGRLLQLPSWVIAVSPFTHVPRLPGDTVDVAPLLALLGIASVLGAVGVFGLRRRDVR